MTPAAPGRAIRREDLAVLLRAVPPGGAVWLVGDTSQLWERWVERVPAAGLAAEDPAVRTALTAAATRLGLALVLESPGDVVPLPADTATRHRPAEGLPGVAHFDPYGVTLRCLARGDDPDYRTVLRYLRNGWMTLEAMDRLLDEVLPRFTRETIAQDPAEFRRKYRGLRQMWKAADRSGG